MGVIRDQVGRWTSGFTSYMGQGEPFLAELRALEHGLKHTWTLGMLWLGKVLERSMISASGRTQLLASSFPFFSICNKNN